MDKYIPTLVASLLLANLSTAWAASNTDLNVTGLITPNACTPGLSDGGTIDHGKLAARDLNPQSSTLLPRHSMRLSVRCEGSTFFALTTVDNREGTSMSNRHHGLGMTPNDEKLGSVALGLSNPVADNTPVRTILSQDGGATWVASSYLGHTGLLAVASVDNTTQPIAVKELDADIGLSTRIARADGLTLIDEVPIDGHVTVELRYL